MNMRKILPLCFIVTMFVGCSRTTESVVMQAGTFDEFSKQQPSVIRTLAEDKEQQDFLEKDSKGNLYPYSYYATENKDVYRRLYDALYALEDEVAISGYSEGEDALYTLVWSIIHDNPDFYYVGNFEVYADCVSFTYTQTEEQIQAVQDKLMPVVASIRAAMPEDLSAYDKYLYLHDYLALNIKYSDLYSNSTNVIGALIDGTCKCQGYVAGYSYLCRAFELPFGVKTFRDVDYHICNVIYYDNNWLCVDVTADDSSENDVVIHQYFGVPETFIEGSLDSLQLRQDGYILTPECYFAYDYSYNMMTGTPVLSRPIDTDNIYDTVVQLCRSKIEQGATTIELPVADKVVFDYLLLNVFSDLDTLSKSLRIDDIMVEYDDSCMYFLLILA